jgi:hypothetical protein
MEATRDMAGVILDFVYLVPRHPMMRLDTGFVEFISFLSSAPLPQLILRSCSSNFERDGASRGISSSWTTRLHCRRMRW